MEPPASVASEESFAAAIPIPSSVSELSLPRFLIIDIPGGPP